MNIQIFENFSIQILIRAVMRLKQKLYEYIKIFVYGLCFCGLFKDLN